MSKVKMPKEYVSLHTHTQFSMLDGYGSVEDYVARAKELGMPALAITDHGNICGAPSFYNTCRAAGIEPILGEEFYFTTDIEKHTEAKKAKRGKKEDKRDAGYQDEDDDGLGRYHFIALAVGHRGYQVLSELSTEAHRNYHYKPLLDRSIIEHMDEKDRKSLVILSGCAASVISKAVLAGHTDRAVENLLWWREMFDNFWMELMHHDTAFDMKLNMGLMKLATKYRVPHVVTNDPHFVMAEDCHVHDALLAIQTASDLDDPDRFKFDGHGYHLRSGEELKVAFKKELKKYPNLLKEGVKATQQIAKLCHSRIPEWENRTWHIPNFPDVKDPNKKLRKLSEKGLKKKGFDKDPTYLEQMEYELKVFEEVNIPDFMLITWDAIREARERRIPVGPGRGSVCGTLVGFLVDIHRVDPIKYGLRFDRFLNPARPKMPDIDTDFGQKRRPEMFDYVEEKYGRENVVHVCAYQHMQLRAAFQSIASAFGIGFKDRLRISKSLRAPEEEESYEDVLPDEIVENYPDLADFLERLRGTKKSISTHPAGVIIADPRDNIRQLVPELWIPNTKRWVGAYDLDAVEAMGLMKQDFLGLKALDTIDECLNMIEARIGERFEPDWWTPDEEEGDKKVYKMLASGDTDGVFQMEGPVNRRGCLEVKPQNFEDLVSITSLYRTGPLRAGYPKQFNQNRKKGRDQIRYAHPLLKPILEPTWGVILYQEQVMDIAEFLAGFDAVAVDEIKEAIKHKKSALMESLKPAFVKGCKKTNNIPSEISSKIWDDIEGYSGYSYNRSHAVAYTLLTYQTARLKRLYPLEFYSALLRTTDTSSAAGKDKRVKYLTQIARRGFNILPPDINISGEGCTPDLAANAIRFGLKDVKGVGQVAAQKILAARSEGPFQSVEAVKEAVGNSGVLAALEACSALDSIGGQGDIEKINALLGWDFNDDMKKWRKKFKSQVLLPEDRKMACTVVGKLVKISKQETKTGKPYVTWTLKYSATESFDVRLWSETESLWSLVEGSIIKVDGTWDPKWSNIQINGTRDITVIKAEKGTDV